ncbi:MAG: molybdopterin-containing oxidoreductase family protein [Acidimicrobiales bacterium]
MKTTSFCRICATCCPLALEVQDGQIVDITGDPENPLFHGYTCVKGRSQHEYMRHEARLLHSLKRQSDGTFAPIPVEQAMDEVATVLERIIDQYGPGSVAGYLGTYAYFPNGGIPVMDSFFKAIGTPMVFNPEAIDKPGKPVALALHGAWMAPRQGYDRPDVAMLFGANPFQSYYGTACGHPGRWLSDQLKRGMELIVVDPRRSDVAKRATLHIQPRPGHDALILASMLHVIIAESLHDAAFVDENTTGLDDFARAVEPFTPELVALRADVPADDLRRAARVFASAPRGYVTAGTGPSMSASGTLVEYLILNLEALCARWLRAGEQVHRVPTLLPAPPAFAQASPPRPAFGYGHPMRVHGLTEMAAGMPTGVLADEILLPGDGQVRALLSVGGNPIAAWPDQLKVIEAMKSLDLLVQFDPWMAATAQHADYVIAPKMALETPAASLITDFVLAADLFYGPERPHAQYADAVVEPPPGSEVIEEWEFFYGLAQRMGLSLAVGSPPYVDLPPTELDMVVKPSTQDLIDILTADSRVPLSEVKRYPHGVTFDEPAVYVQPRQEGWQGRLDLANPTMMDDLAALLLRASDTAAAADDARFPYRLVCRRMQQVLNSAWNDTPTNRGRGFNPAFMHPGDLEALGLKSGDAVQISSKRATIPAVVMADDGLRQGLVSMAHGFGGAPDRDSEFRKIGSPTGRLLTGSEFVDRYSGQTLMSNVPVSVAPLATVVRG